MNKKLRNLARIGDAALGFLYQPCKNEHWECDVNIAKRDMFPQEAHFSGACCNSLYLWSISTGLVEIEIPKFKDGSAEDFIGRQFHTLKELDRFSHIITRHEYTRGGTGIHSDGEHINTYRLTPHFRNLIMVAWDWIKLEEKIA